MRLTDLDPAWLIKDGNRVGFTFNGPLGKGFRQSCLVVAMPSQEQWKLHEAAHGEDALVQGCRSDFAWTIAGGIENANFETMTVTPSIDGSDGGEWHGYITNGEIVGGL